MTQLQRLVIAPDQLHPPQIALTDEQRHYLSRVLRLSVGDRFIAMDGKGQSWVVMLVQGSSSGAVVQAQVLQPIVAATELPVPVTLVAALPKGNGFDEVVRQCTELGVTCVAPVISDRTLLNPSPQRLARWRRIAQEAAEQSERQQVPTILEPVSFAVCLRQEAPATKYLAAERDAAPSLLSCLLNHAASPIAIAIGPEGGWTEAEVAQAVEAGYQPVSLGPRILRAVTAPMVALSLIAATLERES